VLTAVALPFLVACGSKKEETVFTPIEEMARTLEENNSESTNDDVVSEDSDSKEDLII